jgi:uncharacterized membrane protein
LTEELSPTEGDQEALDATPIPREVERTARLTAQFVRQDIRQEIHSYSGDFPDADELVKLDGAHPGTIERVLDYMDREQAHRHQMQDTWTEQEREHMMEAMRLFARGQVMMFLLAGGAIAGGIVLALVDAPAAGLAAIVVALASLALAFIWGRRDADSPPPSAPPDSD